MTLGMFLLERWIRVFEKKFEDIYRQLCQTMAMFPLGMTVDPIQDHWMITLLEDACLLRAVEFEASRGEGAAWISTERSRCRWVFGEEYCQIFFGESLGVLNRIYKGYKNRERKCSFSGDA